MAKSPAAVLLDSSASPVAVKAGDTITPATQPLIPVAGLSGTTVRAQEMDASGRSKVQADALPLPAGASTEATLLLRATEATLEATRVLIASVDTVVKAIRDTAGVKKIVDALPGGDNWIGRTKIGDGTDSVDVINDTELPSLVRLQTEARIAPGSTVSIGTSIPADPADLRIALLKSGGSEDMLVNGSVTSVGFSYAPATGTVLAVSQLLIVFTADDFSFDGDSFGPNSALTNGIKFETDIGGTVTEIFNIKQNEDFLRVPGRIPLVNNTGPKDVLGVAFNFGGLLKLTEADGDQLLITVRDNLTSTKLKYLTATLYGAEV